MKKLFTLFPMSSRRTEFSPDWRRNFMVDVYQGASIEDFTMDLCEITIQNASQITPDMIDDVILCLKEAQRKAREWNHDFGKPARDVLK